MTGALQGRRLFVAGAASGIGLACAARLADDGARIGCFDRDGAELDRLPGLLSAASEIVVIRGDVSSSSDVTAVDRTAEALGGLDGVINCAGIDLLSPLEETTDADWRRIFAVNLDGPMHVCRAALRHVREAGGGTIVNVSSGAGLQPLKHRSAYSSSKAALQMFIKALAMEAAEWSIRANAVGPGAVETGLLAASFFAVADPDAARDTVRARYALARIVDPDEIAAAIVWLSGQESSYVTGIAMAVDGGRTSH